MAINYGYDFYFKIDDQVMTFPITPGSLRITVGSNNETINLINENDINLLKGPALTEVEFEGRFPMRKYPYSRNPSSFQSYFDIFKDLKENRKSFRFIVSRQKPGWDTNLLVALEEMELNEDADEGDDVLINFTLKQYKPYGIRVLKKETSESTSTSDGTREDEKDTSKNQSHKVVYGDCLWNLAKKYYGDGSKYTLIYEANKDALEADAKKHGYSSSSNGNVLYPGITLTIPPKS